MSPRSLAIRISLALLGFTALSAIVLALVPHTPILWTATWSGAIVTVAAALCIPFTFWVARAELRLAAFGGITIVCLEMLLALCAIWTSTLLPGGSASERFSVAMFDVLCAAPVVLAALWSMGFADSRLAARVGLVGAAIGFVLVSLDTWSRGGGLFGWHGDDVDRIAGLLVLAAAFLSTASLARSASFVRWNAVGALAAVASMTLGLILLFIGGAPTPGTQEGWKLALSGYWIAAWIALTHLLLLFALRGWGAWTRAATVVTAGITVSLIVLMILTDADRSLAAPLASMSIATVCGLLATSIFARLQREPAFARVGDVSAEVELTCPRCRHRGTQPVGASACARCGLRFRIEVEEPRCAGCGQLLNRLNSDRCPECGREVAMA